MCVVCCTAPDEDTCLLVRVKTAVYEKHLEWKELRVKGGQPSFSRAQCSNYHKASVKAWFYEDKKSEKCLTLVLHWKSFIWCSLSKMTNLSKQIACIFQIMLYNRHILDSIICFLSISTGFFWDLIDCRRHWYEIMRWVHSKTEVHKPTISKLRK